MHFAEDIQPGILLMEELDIRLGYKEHVTLTRDELNVLCDALESSKDEAHRRGYVEAVDEWAPQIEKYVIYGSSYRALSGIVADMRGAAGDL